MRQSFIATFARESSARSFRIRIPGRVLLALALILPVSPFLASWATGTLIVELLRQNAALQTENANYREATAALASQVSTLQAAADDLRQRADLDPLAAQAMTRLPASITHRAMGGDTGDLTAEVAQVVGAGDPAMGLLRDVLQIIQGQLNRARSGAERRQALAAATPSIWPVTGGLTSPFGTRRDPFTGSQDFHAGLDISADFGQPVRATGDGTVLAARYSGNLGNLVAIDHGYAITTRYGHLAKFAVTEGQFLRKGDVVGFVGSTGRSTSPHVHYELVLNGQPVNPLRLLGR